MSKLETQHLAGIMTVIHSIHESEKKRSDSKVPSDESAENLEHSVLVHSVHDLLNTIEYLLNQSEYRYPEQTHLEMRLQKPLFALIYALSALVESENIALEVSDTHVVVPEGKVISKTELSSLPLNLIDLKRFQTVLSPGVNLRRAV